jgi:hypothetical protein
MPATAVVPSSAMGNMAVAMAASPVPTTMTAMTPSMTTAVTAPVSAAMAD